MFFHVLPLQSRLSDAIEAVEGQLDPTATSDLSQASLVKLIWLLTRQKPCTSIARLKVKNYGDFNARLRRVHERISVNNPRMVQMVEAITAQPVLYDDWIDALAETEGFQPEWFTAVSENPRRGNAGAPLPGQQSLPKMMGAAAKSGAPPSSGDAPSGAPQPVVAARPAVSVRMPPPRAQVAKAKAKASAAAPPMKSMPVPSNVLVGGQAQPAVPAPLVIPLTSTVGLPPMPPPPAVDRVIDTADTEVGADHDVEVCWGMKRIGSWQFEKMNLMCL